MEDSRTQWVIFWFFLVYFAALLLWRMGSQFKTSSTESALRQLQHYGACLWISFALGVCAVNYARNYSSSDEALMLLAGALLGQGLVAWAALEVKNQRPEVRNYLWFSAIFMLTALLTLGASWTGDSRNEFAYQGRSRWTGPWENPNLFGLLMAAGMLLAMGLVLLILKSQIQNRTTAQNRKWVMGKSALSAMCLAAFLLMARGMFHSYSRGAWLGSGCGLLFLAGSKFGPLYTKPSKAKAAAVLRWRKNWLPALVITGSLIVIGFWHFRQTDWHPARRAFSAVNAADFSWRNRVAAWQGALQITADHSWLGAGWNQPEPLYQHYYLPSKLSDGLAIEMNDYLLFAATLGVPALFCFGIYLWLSLTAKTKNEGHDDESGPREAEEEQPASLFGRGTFASLQTICRAGAIVLLVGFWFDGGLFRLPTAATFWILLEMGGMCDHQIRRLTKAGVDRILKQACRRRAGLSRQVIPVYRAQRANRSGHRRKITAPGVREGVLLCRQRRGTQYQPALDHESQPLFRSARTEAQPVSLMAQNDG